MADSAVAVTAGTGTNIDTRTEATNGNHRQVIVLGDPATNAGVAPVDATAGLKVDLGADNDITGTVTANLSATDNAVLDQIELNTDPLLVVGSGTEATAQRVTIATDSTGVLSVDDNGSTLSIDDGGGAITVDGTVAVTNAGLTEVAAAINASSQMDVNIAASDISFGGTSAADDADFTATTTPGTPAMGVYESSPTSVTDGDLGVAGITSTRALKVQAQANSGVDIGDVTINNATIAVTQSGTWDEVGINDSGNSITVDATNLDVRDLVAASDAVTVHGDVGVIDQLDLTNSNPAAVAIVDGDGTQITSFGGGTQYSDGDANADPTGTVAMGTDGSNVFAVHTDTSGDLQVDILSIAAGDNNIGNVDVASSALPTGASTLAEQQSQTTHLATIAGDTTSIQAATELIDDAIYADDADWTDNTSKHMLVGGIYQSTPHTVTDGDVAPVSLDANGNVKVNIVAGSSAGTQYTEGDEDASITGTAMMMEVAADIVEPVQGTVADGLLVNLGSNNDVTVAGVATAANQTTIIGHVDGIETLIGTTNTTLGTIDTDTGNIATSTSNMDTSLNAIEAGYAAEGAALGSGVLLQGDDGTDRTNVLVDTSGHLQVDVLTAPTTTVQATDLDIRDLTATDVVTANLSATDNAVLDSIDTSTQGILADTAAIQTAVETIDNAISGSEMQVDVVAALPAGTNALGKILPPDTDVTAHTNYAKKYYTSAGAATDGIIWSPAAGKRWHVVSMFINVSAAATVTLEDDKSGGDEAVMKMELAANSGTVINFSEKYPFASGEDAADLTITTTAGNVYVTCTGYEV